MGNSALRTDEEITRVYEKYVDTVYKVCFMMLKNVSETEDATQNVFIKYMKDDKELMARCGKENPFRTPEGYFEHFHDQLMNSLPEPELTKVQPSQVTLFTRIKPWLYMAAMFCGIMLSVRIFVGKPQQEEFPISQAEAEMLPEEEWENFMRRSFNDDYETYQFLTEADNNY